MVPLIATCEGEIVSLSGLYRILREFRVSSLVLLNCCQVQHQTSDRSTLFPTSIVQLSSSLPNTLTFVPNDNQEYLSPFPAIINEAFALLLAQPLVGIITSILERAKAQGIQVWKEESGLPFNFTLA